MLKLSYWQKTENKDFWIFAFISITASLLAVALDTPIPLLLPLAGLFLGLAVLSPKQLFYFFFAILPFSVEIHTGSLGTDLPSEPIMIFFVGLFIVLAITKSSSTSKAFFLHPISLVILLHLSWICLTSLTSTVPLFSFKFLLAKLWYVIPFFFLPFILMKKERDFRQVFSFLSVGLFIAIGYVLARHAAEGFSFASSNEVMRPIFRNHVSYALMLAAFLPYYWYLIKSKNQKLPWINYLLFLYLLIAIYFSYTRAAQASVILALVFYCIMKWRLVKLGIAVALVSLTLLIMHLSVNNNYLDYAPDFTKAVAHKKFDNLIEATTKMQDVSTVERFYRWIAGAYMVKEKPWVGFGPSTFYTSYDGYTVSSYKTYVSDNPEKSGMHNNYLMTAVEQGLPGLCIMLLLAFLPLLYAEQCYHQLQDLASKALVMAAATSFFLIDVTLLMNELIEVDKIGPLYFLSASIIVYYSVQINKNDQSRLA